MKVFKTILAYILCIWIFSMACSASPVINYTSQDQYVKVDFGTSYTFTVTANESIDSWEWYLNDVARVVDANSLTISFSGRGQQNLTVVGTNAEGESTYTFFPYILREIAVSDTESINDTGYDELMDAVHENDLNAGIEATTIPGTSVMGGFYYLFVLGLPFYMIWNRQQKLLIPSVVGLILGWLILPFMPEQYVKFLQLAIVLGASAVIWTVYKDR